MVMIITSLLVSGSFMFTMTVAISGRTEVCDNAVCDKDTALYISQHLCFFGVCIQNLCLQRSTEL